MYHYTYLIQHKTEDKRYIGVRSSTVPPLLDTSYWGSSKHLPSDVHVNHVKIILKVHATRKDALMHEILLHDLNDVAVNPTYYNKAKQTSLGFDTSGVPITPEIKRRLSKKLKGRIFSDEHKQNISESLQGKPKSEEHRKNCSIAQKKLASLPGYKNPRSGAVVSEEARKKLSDSIKASGCNASINNNRFKPWFITRDNVTYLYYDKTKEEISLLHGHNKDTYQALSAKSKGYLTIKRGKLKGIVTGNIEDAQANMHKIPKPLLKTAWFITYPTHSEPFYYESRKDYAERTGIKTQAVADAIHLSKGTKIMKRGPFKGLILGRIS